MSQTAISYQLKDIDAVAAEVLNHAGHHRIFVFYGQMGAGKTTLIKALCNHLGVEGTTSSPTFAIVNEYQANNTRIYHFDFYRLKEQVEALDIGCEEYFYSGDYCFIEWPEKIPDLLPEHYFSVSITAQGNDTRDVTLAEF